MSSFESSSSSMNIPPQTKRDYKNAEEEKQEALDVDHLEKMGYKQELHRGFSSFMSFAFCFTSTSVVVSIALSFDYTLKTGGSGVAVWSWVIGSLFTILVAYSLAEICSVYPNAGSVYHWSGQLAPADSAPLISYLCGWLSFVGNVTGDASYSYGFVYILNAIIMLHDKPSLSTTDQVLISIIILFTWSAVNTLRINQQGWLNNLSTIFQLSATLIIVIVLFIMTPKHATVHDVFFSTYNGTGFPFVYVCCISILSTLFSLSGYADSANLAEETKDAGRTAPKEIVLTCICSAIAGFIYLLAVLFTIPNVAQFVKDNEENENENGDTLDDTVATFKLALSYHGTLILTILLLISFYFAGVASITTTTRLYFSLARDGIFPLSHYFRWIYEGTKAPLAAIISVFVINSILLLFQLISTTAFNAFITLSTSSLQISYLIPVLLRCTTARKTFVLGEFNLGRLSIPIAIISSIWLTITSIILCLPQEYPMTWKNMNYSIVAIVGVLFLAGIYWFVSARYWFTGPKRIDLDTTPLLSGHATNENVVSRISSSEGI
ncbi:unnamed protein product [Adineta steineri]|uniref:Amino acid transporter n=2 Tax=Adineta steineri TaxID=433720 RepID=A0A814J805_9BILA|nr:unnamed protein product [Adineta steineri]